MPDQPLDENEETDSVDDDELCSSLNIQGEDRNNWSLVSRSIDFLLQVRQIHVNLSLYIIYLLIIYLFLSMLLRLLRFSVSQVT